MTKDMENILSKLPYLIQQLVEKGIEVHITEEGFLLPGWYKYNGVILEPRVETHLDKDVYSFRLITSRYHYILAAEIGDLEDLAYEHFSAWKTYAERAGNIWSSPESAWIPLLKEFKLIEEKPQIVSYLPTNKALR